MSKLLFLCQAILKDGFRIWWLAPLIPAFIVIPEFIQHVVEIRLGMFENREVAIELASNSARMTIGSIKTAGLFLAMLTAIRFWGARQNGYRWWDLRTLNWRHFALAIILIILTTLPGTLLQGTIGVEKAGWIDIAFTLATLPLLILLVHGLSGHRTSTLKSVFRDGWFAALRMIVLVALIWIPLQYLHGLNHKWAMGGSDVLVWILMIFDTFVVGLMAMLVGTTIHHASLKLDEITNLT